ncbi:MAG: flagellar FliJ family protein [Deltaproteobacteria bacterium]|nr:flagellar FliJ family protein [Candidatus Tharpella aukensis]
MFKFSLEAVLKHRLIREENAARVLSEVTEQLRQVQESFLRLQVLQGEELLKSQAALVKGVPVEEMELARFREVKLMHEVNAARKLVEDTAKERLAKEEELLSCVKERRLLEKVREKHFQAYKLESDKLELRNLDEIAVIRAARLKK